MYATTKKLPKHFLNFISSLSHTKVQYRILLVISTLQLLFFGF
jgi:hypothetical protein